MPGEGSPPGTLRRVTPCVPRAPLHLSVPVLTGMDNETPDDDGQRAVERDRIDAKIQELKRQKASLTNRIGRLEQRRSRLTADEDGETPEVDIQNIVLGHLSRLEDDDEGALPVSVERLLDAVEAEGVSRDAAEGALTELKRQGEVYQPTQNGVRKV